MPYTEYPPAAALQGRLKCFWSIVDEPSDEVQEVWPDGCVELIFHPGNIFIVEADGASRRLPPVAVIGLQSGVMRARAEGEVRLFGARMLPLQAAVWEAVELEALRREIDPLLMAGAFERAAGVVGNWLLRQPALDSSATGALRTLYAKAGNVRVAELAAKAGVSPRQLERNFSKELGISPKTLARVVRFAESWSQLLRRPDLSLAGLALELGYSDQAHFSHEFSAFGQRSPREFRRTFGNS